MRDSQILHQKDGYLLEGSKVFLTCNSHPEDGVCVWRGGGAVEGRGQNKTVTISTAIFTYEKLRTARSNMVQTTVQCQPPENAARNPSQSPPPSAAVGEPQDPPWVWLRNSFPVGSICERHMPHARAIDQTPTKEDNLILGTYF